MSPANEQLMSFGLLSAVQSVSTTWLFSFLYVVPVLLIIDIIRLTNRFLHFLPHSLTSNPQMTGIVIALTIILSLIAVFTYGYVKFNHPVIVNINFKTEKYIANPPKIVVASDLHIGYTIGKDKASEFVTLINAQKPDMVLLCGDIFDRSTHTIEVNHITAILKQIHAPLGVYAVVGNHEYYGNLPRAVELLREANMVVLQDSVVEVQDIYIIGRDDRSNSKRQSLQSLVANLDTSKLQIVLDHQPSNLAETESAKVDFQFSGHTHDGQIFPVNLIIRNMYEQSYGYLCKGSTQYFVTSGLGLWGAKYRIGTQSELIVVTFD
jgi:predicted MPP superfamily phosphohydrolase